MRVCFIAQSSSIHVKRIVSDFVDKKDDVLVLSTSVLRSDIPGTRTVHLLSRERFYFSSSNDKGKGKAHIIGFVKSFIPRSLKHFIKRMVRNFRLLRSRQFCLEQVQRFDPDVIYCFRSFPEGMLGSLSHVRPLLLRTAGPDISKFPRYPVYKQLIRKALRESDLVVTESLWEQRLIRDLCGDAVKTEVSIIGIDTNMFRPPNSRERLRNKYRLPRDAFVVVTNRYLDGHYNGWQVVRAVEGIMCECPDLVLLYVSPSKMGARAKGKAAAINKRFPRIKFVEGPVAHSEVADILGCAEIYISLSAFDGIPNSVLEAMACGVVPIVAELPQLHEWVEHGVSGYFVKQYDINGLATMVNYAYKNREALSDMAVRCVSTIRERGSYEGCMERTRNLLKGLVETHDGRDGFRNEDG